MEVQVEHSLLPCASVELVPEEYYCPIIISTTALEEGGAGLWLGVPAGAGVHIHGSDAEVRGFGPRAPSTFCLR